MALFFGSLSKYWHNVTHSNFEPSNIIFMLAWELHSLCLWLGRKGTNNKNHQEFKCNICKKGFVLKWRLQKHMKIHNNKNCQPCHYFNNGKMCPFEELGCKFLHINSKLCRFGQECDNKMCPFRHSQEKESSETNGNISKLNDAEISNMEENDSPDKSVFVTSTPRKIACEECRNQSQCVDCFVRQENPSFEQFSDWQATILSTPDRVGR